MKGAPLLEQSHKTEASLLFFEADETWKSLLFWLEYEIAQQMYRIHLFNILAV